MKQLMILALIAIVGCGGGNNFKSSGTEQVSMWSGTYTGQLNLKGCPGTTSCGGDSVTLTIAQVFGSNDLTATGTYVTTGESLNGTGSAQLSEAAPANTGGQATSATLQVPPSTNLYLLGVTSAYASSPEPVNAISISSAILVNNKLVAGAFYGNLERK